MKLYEVFSIVRKHNQMSKFINSDVLDEVIKIYIDESLFYEGNEYFAFEEALEKEFVIPFALKVIDVNFDCSEEEFFTFEGRKHKIEIYIIRR